MAQNDLTTQTPVEIDTVLYKNWLEQAQQYVWILSTNKTIARLEAEAAKKGQLMAWDQRSLDEARSRLEGYYQTLSDLQNDAHPYEAEYVRRGRWNRYYLVTNSNGHVHRGMDCKTCFPDTQYAWIVDLADCDEDKMVEEYGEKACTICFPNAPTNPAFTGPGRRDRAALEARQAEKQARADAKAAKLLVEPVRVGRYGRFETVASAKQGIRDAITYRTYYGDSDGKYGETITVLTEALLRKGVTQDEIDTLIERATKKAQKESGR